MLTYSRRKNSLNVTKACRRECKLLAATSESKKSKHTFPWCFLGLNKFLKLPFWRMREAVEAWS
jgi:hypothetical protein